MLGNEIEFKNGGEYPPIEIELDDNRKIEITGKIDRADYAENDDGKYIRIIDYKSSVKDIDLNYEYFVENDKKFTYFSLSDFS